MATNYVQDGEVITYTNASTAISAGDVVPLSNRCGVALVDIANGESGSVQLSGVFTVGKTTSQTWAVGEALYHVASTGKLSTTSTGNVPAGFAFAAAGSSATTGQVLLGGQLALAQAAVVAALTDSSGGAAADGTIATNEAVSVISIPVQLATIADGDIVTAWTPGFAGKILSTAFIATVVASTGGKASTLNLEIGTTNVAGGTLALTTAGLDTLGKVVAGAAVTADNTFTASDTISVEASSTTAFSQGAGVLLITVASTVANDNAKDVATKVNAILTALKNAGLMASS